MRREKWFFGIGLIAGVVLSGIVLLYVAPRYTLVRTDDTVVRQDTWSGQAWCLVNESWKPLSSDADGWADVDAALAEALNIQYAEVDTAGALKKLRDKYPVLREVPERELLQRIKVVYSNELLSALYLQGFLDIQE